MGHRIDGADTVFTCRLHDGDPSPIRISPWTYASEMKQPEG